MSGRVEARGLPKASATAQVAAIGAGYWGRNIVRNLAELGALAAVVDRDQAVAAAEAALHGTSARQIDAVLSDQAIDAVAIAAPAAQHAALVRDALDAGKHVFVEKPLALDVAEAEALVARAARQGRALMVGHLLQYHPAFLALRAAVAEGRLGRVRYVSSSRLNLGKIRREEDILWSFAPHDISMILALLGTEPSRVSAEGAWLLHDSIADITTTHLAFPGGERAHIHVSWFHPVKEQRLTVIGERAMAVFDDGQPWPRKLMIYPHEVVWQNNAPVPRRAEGEPVALVEGEPLRAEMQHFLDSIATGATPRTDGAEGVRVLRVLSAASASLAAARHGVPEAKAPAAPALPDMFVHASATVEPGARVGAGTKIWNFSRVLKGSNIGQHCVIGQNVTIGPDVSVGDRCKIQNNVSLYRGVTLEDGVFCGPACVFTNVMTPRAEIERKNEFLPTLVRRGATVGANATIICGTTLGEYCMVGAGAVVTRDVPAFALVVGNPARRIGWVGHAGERLRAAPEGTLICPRTGRRYAEAAPDRLEEIA
jgi:predicted dehydrogenase/acetyltransferase-like isoleucine patch superfamily enzyme